MINATPMKCIVARFIAPIFLAGICACTTCRPIPVQSVADIQSIRVEPEKNYEIEFTNGRTYRMKGSSLAANNGLMGVKFEGEESYRYYQYDQFKKICAMEKDPRKTKFAIIGGVAGGLLVIGGIIFGAIMGGLARANE